MTEPGSFEGTPRFEVVGLLGEGGMGVVYEALDRERGVRVALKTLRAWSAEALLRFKAEFRGLADLHHPNLVALGELHEHLGQWFFTMELVRGRPLLAYVRAESGEATAGSGASVLADASEELEGSTQDVSASAGEVARRPQGAADEGRLRSVLEQITRGLQALHASGRVHRDVKPSNVLVTAAGQVKILDFGLVSELASPDEQELRVGTLAYMAPEQTQGGAVGPAADWYALGVVLFEALTGRLPFEGSSEAVLIWKRTMEAPPPSSVRRGLPVDLERLCVELLSLEAARRPGAREIAARLGFALEAGEEEGPRARFVGRASELAGLVAALDEARGRGGLAVLVTGESGVGKSALVGELGARARERGAWVLHGRCHEREAVPFKAIDGLIDALSRQLSGLSEGEARGLLPLDGDLLVQAFPVLRRWRPLAEAPARERGELEPAERRALLFGAVRGLLGALSELRPLLLLIDDVQWADADSLALLSEALRPPGPRALLVMSARAALASERETRSAEQVAEHLGRQGGEVRRLHLGPLPERDALEMARDLAQQAGEPLSAAEALAREAGGHPLFLDALLRGRQRGAAGGTLEEALWERVRSLEEAPRRLLVALSVAGGPLPQEQAGDAAGMGAGEVADALRPLRAGRLAHAAGAGPRDGVEPYHDRVRNAVLLHLGAEERRSWHRRLASTLGRFGVDDGEALSIHLEGAGEPAAAARHAARAAGQASAALAFERSSRLYRRALALAPESDEGPGWTAALGDALASAGRGAEAAEALLGAAAALGGEQELALRRRAAEQFLRAGHIDRGLDAVRGVLATEGMALPATPRSALASLLLRRAQVRLRGLGHALRPEAAVAREQLARIDVCYSVAATLGLVDNIRGSYFQTRGLLLALEAGEPLRLARSLALEAAYSSAEGGAARERTAAIAALARELAGRTGDPYTVGWCRGLGGMAAALEGRWLDAVDDCEQAERALRASCTGVAWELATVRWFALWSSAYLGRVAEMARLIPARLRDAEQRGDLHAVLGHSTALAGLVWLADDDPEQARRRADEAMGRWSRRTFHVEHWWDMHGQALIDLYEGDGLRALDGLARGWPGLRGSMLLMVQATRSEALLARSRASLAAALQRPADAARHLADAERDARRVLAERMLWSTPLARLCLAACAHARGDAAEAAARLAVAEAGLDAASMPLFAAAARVRRGALLGGDRGSALGARGLAALEAQGVRAPERLLRVLAPGFGDAALKALPEAPHELLRFASSRRPAGLAWCGAEERGAHRPPEGYPP